MSHITKIDNLLDKLPHGSGINGEWNIEYKRNKFYAHNCYYAMNENGYYCHDYDFTATYRYNGLDCSKPCDYCNHTGYRQFSEMYKYGWDDPSLLNKSFYHGWFTTIYPLDNVGYPDGMGLSFVCNTCQGKGYTLAKEWELIRLNFHGQREYACCGYELKDYLYDVLSLTW